MRYKISDLAKLLDVSTNTVRRYEDMGYISAVRDENSGSVSYTHLTIIEKIIGKNIGREVKPGDIVTVNVDRVMIHDIFIPFVKEKFEEMGFCLLYTSRCV